MTSDILTRPVQTHYRYNAERATYITGLLEAAEICKARREEWIAACREGSEVDGYESTVLEDVEQTLHAAAAKYVPDGYRLILVKRLSDLLDWMWDEQCNQTCSNICDKTYESQGCPSGTCAIESGKEELCWWKELLSASEAT